MKKQKVLTLLISLIAVFLLIDSLPDQTGVAAQQPQQNPTPAGAELFTNVSAAAGVTATHRASWNEYSKNKEDFTDGYMAVGQAWGDYDNDGWVDLYVTGNLDDNILYHNNGNGGFSVSPLSAGVSLPGVMSGGAIWADYDNDGWRDLYVVNYGPNVLFHNDQGRGFTDVTAVAGVGDAGKGTSATWGDYDEDGYLDLYVVNWSCYPKCDPLDNNLASDRLYHNNGDGTFSDVSHLLVYEKLLGAGFTASFADYDNDGDVDLYIINDMLKNPIGNVLWRNEGPGCNGWCWTDASVESGAFIIKHSMGIAIGDYDNDQDLDIYFSDMVNPMALLQNNGKGVFTDVAEAAGVAVGPSSAVGWGTAFFDYNNDGWQDLYLTTTEFIQESVNLGPQGMHFSYPDFLFQNNGNGGFSDVTPASWKAQPNPSMGLAYADYDQDGWVDFVLGNWNEGYALYRNQGLAGQGNHWLTIRLVGAGRVNRDAVGARAYVRTNDGRTQMQEVISGSSLGAGNDMALHFGLGQAAIEQVTIVWPDGLTQQFNDVLVDQIWQVTYQPTANNQLLREVSILAIGQPVAARVEAFTDVSQAAGINASHRGIWDMFKKDFTSGYLGIGQAWGDYDNDGWVDLYVTGNLDDNVLYHNNQDGTFNISPLSANVSLPGMNSGGATWADYDNDGWRDLYVVNQGPDVLFHNDQGKGFSDVTVVAGVGDTGKGSGATWGDYDKDGYLDLYVVNWACSPECGEPFNVDLSSDRLYHNNGDGTFSDVSHLLVYDKLLGAGFAASFVDYDNDYDLDIYVVNDALKNPIGNVLWRNEGPGCNGWCWTDASAETGAGVIIEGMGLAVGDYDNDQDLDFYFSNMVNPMALLQNQAGSRFIDIADAAGVAVGPSSAVGWGTAFFDYNNDGGQDLYLTTTEFIQHVQTMPPEGMHFSYPDFLFQNNGNGAFSDVTPASWTEKATPSMGFAYADYDNDGWVDFVLGNWNQGYSLYHNQGLAGAGNHWLTMRLVGAGPVNRDGVGTRVYLYTTDGRVLMQEVICGSSLGAGNDTALHFGLGQAAIEKVKIIWPDGLSYTYIGVPIDQIWQVTYGEEPQALPWPLIGLVLFLAASPVVLVMAALIAWKSLVIIPYAP
jgi:hypothetical protein